MRKKRVVRQQPPVARVVVDSRDSSRDRFISLSEARDLYARGELAMDLTNSAYYPVPRK